MQELQGLGPLALELEWWHGEEGEQPCHGCGSPMPLKLQVYCAGAQKSAVFSPLHTGACWWEPVWADPRFPGREE